MAGQLFVWQSLLRLRDGHEDRVCGERRFHDEVQLDAPADPTLPQTPRPEWYFRSLFELRRYFTGDREFVATMLIPAALLSFFVSFPLIDRKCSPRWSTVLRIVVVLIGVGSWGGLTAMSYIRDWKDAEYLASSRETNAISARARELADRAPLPAVIGLPPSGPP